MLVLECVFESSIEVPCSEYALTCPIFLPFSEAKHYIACFTISRAVLEFEPEPVPPPEKEVSLLDMYQHNWSIINSHKTNAEIQCRETPPSMNACATGVCVLTSVYRVLFLWNRIRGQGQWWRPDGWRQSVLVRQPPNWGKPYQVCVSVKL